MKRWITSCELLYMSCSFKRINPRLRFASDFLPNLGNTTNSEKFCLDYYKHLVFLLLFLTCTPMNFYTRLLLLRFLSNKRSVRLFENLNNTHIHTHTHTHTIYIYIYRERERGWLTMLMIPTNLLLMGWSKLGRRLDDYLIIIVHKTMAVEEKFCGWKS